MIERRTLLLGSALTVLPLPASADIKPVTRGMKLRKELLDTLRPVVEYQMGGPVEFVVTKINLFDNVAFLVVDPQRPGGGQIRPDETLFRNEIDMMDGFTVFALLVRNGGRWAVMQHVTGPTDVAFEGWPEYYDFPRELIWSN